MLLQKYYPTETEVIALVSGFNSLRIDQKYEIVTRSNESIKSSYEQIKKSNKFGSYFDETLSLRQKFVDNSILGTDTVSLTARKIAKCVLSTSSLNWEKLDHNAVERIFQFSHLEGIYNLDIILSMNTGDLAYPHFPTIPRDCLESLGLSACMDNWLACLWFIYHGRFGEKRYEYVKNVISKMRSIYTYGDHHIKPKLLKTLYNHAYEMFVTKYEGDLLYVADNGNPAFYRNISWDDLFKFGIKRKDYGSKFFVIWAIVYAYKKKSIFWSSEDEFIHSIAETRHQTKCQPFDVGTLKDDIGIS